MEHSTDSVNCQWRRRTRYGDVAPGIKEEKEEKTEEDLLGADNNDIHFFIDKSSFKVAALGYQACSCIGIQPVTNGCSNTEQACSVILLQAQPLDSTHVKGRDYLRRRQRLR